jgi:hypothetical protein
MSAGRTISSWPATLFFGIAAKKPIFYSISVGAAGFSRHHFV